MESVSGGNRLCEFLMAGILGAAVWEYVPATLGAAIGAGLTLTVIIALICDGWGEESNSTLNERIIIDGQVYIPV